MSSITYTALREMEADGYAKSGTDISAAGADDSFNSVSTDLTGLPNDDWVLVAGFANAANNGWFQANGASILHKVTQDTTASLVTEAAGPAIMLTGYKRGVGQSYAFDFGIARGDRSVKTKSASHQPMGGGQPETVFFRDEKFWAITTGLIQESSILVWREFLGSVAGGESFTMDRYGTAASPVESKTVVLASTDYIEARDGSLYPGRYRISFTVRLLT